MIRFLIFGIVLCSCWACKSPASPSPQQQLQAGDLFFQDLDCGPLCDAIEAVTTGVNGQDFSHCGLVVQVGDSLKVLEAIGSEVQLTALSQFLGRSVDSVRQPRIVAARLKPEFRSILPDALAFAQSQVGQPYDDPFLANNGKWYCSELIHAAFQKANGGKELFQLEPMTFKDPKNQAFFPAWVDYYKQLGIDIPEGQPGINPGGMSRASCLAQIPSPKL